MHTALEQLFGKKDFGISENGPQIDTFEFEGESSLLNRLHHPNTVDDLFDIFRCIVHAIEGCPLDGLIGTPGELDQGDISF
jgi:hypothetical protein